MRAQQFAKTSEFIEIAGPARSESQSISTARLNLTPTTSADAEVMFREFSTKVARYMGAPVPADLAAEQTHVEREIQGMRAGEKLVFTAKGKDGSFIGAAVIGNLQGEAPYVGCWIKESAWGAGYGTETFSALVDWVSRNLDASRIDFVVHPENAGSRRIAEKLGGVLQPPEKTEASRMLVYHLPSK